MNEHILLLGNHSEFKGQVPDELFAWGLTLLLATMLIFSFCCWESYNGTKLKSIQFLKIQSTSSVFLYLSSLIWWCSYFRAKYIEPFLPA